MSAPSPLAVMRITWLAAFREALSNRRGFWVQLGVMFANDVVWIVFWFLFFREVGEVRGWDTDSLMVLLAVLTTAGGITLGVFANARQIGVLAADGGLDAVLALPVPPLAHLLARRVHPSNLGDAVFGVLLFAVLGNPTPARTAAFVFGVVVCSMILGGFLVLVGSSAFFVGRNDASDLGFHAVIMFSSYPVDIFSGAAKVFLYTVVPAGFISAVPARLVDDFHLPLAAAELAVAVGTVVLAWWVFTAGLRRYTSGAVWTRA